MKLDDPPGRLLWAGHSWLVAEGGLGDCLQCLIGVDTSGVARVLKRKDRRHIGQSATGYVERDGTLYFSDWTPQRRADIWVSDGTEPGTRPTDFISGIATPAEWAVALGNERFFMFLPLRTEFGEPGRPSRPIGLSVWKSDGTREGTYAVAKHLGATDPGSWYLDSAIPGTALGNGRSVFAKHAPYGFTLWGTDGETQNTVEITGTWKELRTNQPVITPGNHTRFFFATDPSRRPGLWKTDGVTASLLHTWEPHQRPGDLVGTPDILFFLIDSTLWKSDGTEMGTYFVYDFGTRDSLYIYAFGDLAIGSVRKDGVSSSWSSNGTGVRFRDDAVQGGGFAIHPENGPWFRVEGNELWRTDGRTSHLVRKFSEGTRILVGESTNSAFFFFTTAGGGFLHPSYRGPSTVEFTLWATDGFSANTVLPPITLRIAEFYGSVGNRMVFRLTGDAFDELWASDGTQDGTGRLLQGTPNRRLTIQPVNWSYMDRRKSASQRKTHQPQGSPLFFTVEDDALGTEIWATDGTVTGTRMVRDINPGPAGSDPAHLEYVGTRVVFSASDGTHGRELWVSDGTQKGTYMLGDVHPGPEGSDPKPDWIDGSRLYFHADDGVVGNELWSVELPDGNARNRSH